MPKFFAIFLLLLVVQNAASRFAIQREKNHIGVTIFNTSDNITSTGVGLKTELSNYGGNSANMKILLRGQMCQCDYMECNCYGYINIPLFNYYADIRMRFAYTPDNGDFTISLYENNNRIFYRTLSLRSRSVFCLPILRFVKFCLTLSDTYFNQNNLHTCLNLETRIFFTTVLTLRFNCVEIGPNGINWAQQDYIASENMEETQQQIDEPAVYDAVDFEQLDLEIYANYTSVLTPEEEAEIGQLKLKLFDKIDDRVMFVE